jgi:hypothetical protein
VILSHLRKLALASALAFLTAACGGGDDVASGGIGGTGISTGGITGFGSIFVNGFEFDLTGVPITIDDQPGTEGDLQLGQVVTVTTDIESDGTVTVTSVVFDDNVDGPISDEPVADADGLTKTFTVLGTTVVVDVDESVFSTDLPVVFDFDTIAQNDVVQISGFFDDNDVLQAKHIEKTGVATPGLAVEVKGTIEALDTGAQTFMLRTLAVHYNNGTDLTDVPSGLADGLFVEVKGILQGDGSVFATEVELEGVAQNAVAAAVEGIVTDFNSNSDFFVSSGNGPVRVDAAGATFDPLGLVLTNGVEVEVDGPIVNGTLFANHVELRNALIKLETFVSTVDEVASTVTLSFPNSQSVIVFVDPLETRMQDKVGGISPFTLSDIDDVGPVLDFLRVKARDDGEGNLIAKEIKRTNPRDTLVQAPVDASRTGTGSDIWFLPPVDIMFGTDGSTQFEDLDDSIFPGGAADFFDALSDGALVKVKDEEPADGVGDVAELED